MLIIRRPKCLLDEIVAKMESFRFEVDLLGFWGVQIFAIDETN